MVSVSISLATFALCSAAVVANGHPQDNQLFTEYSLAGTTTVHVPADTAKGTTTSPEVATNSTESVTPIPTATGIKAPNTWVRAAVEGGSILWSNYRKVGVSHQEAVKLVRDGINLYITQPDITNLINEAYQYATDNFVSFAVAKNITLPDDICLKALRAFTDANDKFLNSPGFAEVDSYLRTNINKFDIGSIIFDIQNLIEIDPTASKDALQKLRAKVNENPENSKAVKEFFSLAVKYAKAYGIQTDVIQNGVASILPSLM